MIRPMTCAILFFCLVATAAGTAAAAQELEQSLKQKYEGKILVLRHSLQSDSQQYDSDGKAVKGGREGTWTLYGRMKVDEVKLSSDKLVLKGHRVNYKLDPSVRQLSPFPSKTRMTLQISLSQPPKNLGDADDVLGRIFALNRNAVLESATPLWRDYLDRNMAPNPGEVKPSPPAQPVIEPETPELLLRGETPPKRSRKMLNLAAPDVHPPRPLSTPEPEFPEVASHENYQAVVVLNVIVDVTGQVQDIRLMHPAGMGLDESAVATVGKWRFKPAERDGEPIAIEMNIEVAFNKF